MPLKLSCPGLINQKAWDKLVEKGKELPHTPYLAMPHFLHPEAIRHFDYVIHKGRGKWYGCGALSVDRPYSHVQRAVMALLEYCRDDKYDSTGREHLECFYVNGAPSNTRPETAHTDNDGSLTFVTTLRAIPGHTEWGLRIWPEIIDVPEDLNQLDIEHSVRLDAPSGSLIVLGGLAVKQPSGEYQTVLHRVERPNYQGLTTPVPLPNIARVRLLSHDVWV